ncbi:MAG: flagellar biosynthesis protein FlgN [Sedimentitalea sp.]|nr:flagellar biosynthesis protein FlgN [Sedimentitalea sp.]
MAHEASLSLIRELDELLDRERRALVEGDLELLGRLLVHKEGLIGRINGCDSLERSSLQGVHDKVSRNQALLNSAMEGIRAVADRMATLRRVRRSLETYDRSGRKTRFGTETRSSVEKRA